jgi:hypothetical protein
LNIWAAFAVRHADTETAREWGAHSVELIANPMKRLILTSMVAAFACVCAVQAGENTDKTKAACNDKSKAEQTKGCCAESACCAKETKARIVSKAPPKGAMLLVQR